MKIIKLVIKPEIKRRDLTALELWSNPLYKQKVIPSKKKYNRNKMKRLMKHQWSKDND
jgi:hypothetical protein|nr:MAG TPA: hypothetical protein [Caudoviricetes sp.]